MIDAKLWQIPAVKAALKELVKQIGKEAKSSDCSLVSFRLQAIFEDWQGGERTLDSINLFCTCDDCMRDHVNSVTSFARPGLMRSAGH